MEVELVPLCAEHLEFLRTTRNDPRVQEWLFTDVEISKTAQAEWFRKYTDDATSLLLVGITDVPVGYVQMSHIDREKRSCEVGICVAPGQQQKGCGRAMLEQAMRYSRDELGLRLLCLEVFASNERAIRLYERVGFKVEQLLKGKVLKRGRPRDVLLMSVVLE